MCFAYTSETPRFSFDVKRNAQVFDEVPKAEMSKMFLTFPTKQEADIMSKFKLELPKAAAIVNLQFKSATLQEHTGRDIFT